MEADTCTQAINPKSTNSGAFYLTIPSIPWYNKLGSFNRKSHEEKVESDLYPVVERYSASLEEDSVLARLSTVCPPALDKPHLSKFVSGNGGLVLRPHTRGDGDGMGDTSPHCQYDDVHKRVCVLFGWLSNAQELLGQEGALHLGTAKRAPYLPAGFDVAHSATTAGSAPSLATSVVLALYDRLGPTTDLLLLLTGQFALVVYDEAKGCCFAARSTVPGDDELFFSVSDGDGVMFTSSLQDLPPHAAHRVWQPIPPGHFVSGKEPVLTQFALTREQLAQRARREDSGEALEDLHISYDSTPHGSPSHASSLIRRLSKRLSDPWRE